MATTAPVFDALVFDFDGVIMDSATLKRAAFAALYDDQSAPVRQAVAAYLGRRGGQPREVKFRHIEGQILRRSVSQARIDELCHCFKDTVAERLAAAPMIAGALEALERWQGRVPLILLSATPHQELQDTVEHRGLAHYFDEVIGAPPDKVTALGNLMVRRGLTPGATVMIGDSYNDYRAARSNRAAFIGVTADPRVSPFPTDTPTVIDLRGLDRVLHSPTA
ncbi:HAD family hydrolase [Halomonas sp. V046]|uniref:HAD family hydrolase n=1 Tax=Halomonas sp. V046 TaxID=3459611 RepID=UPI00404495D9